MVLKAHLKKLYVHFYNHQLKLKALFMQVNNKYLN